MTAIHQRLQMWRTNEVFGQLVRFGITGVAVTLFYSAIYWPLATYGNRIVHLGTGAVWPLVAVAIAFFAATLVGRYAHGAISFRGHGTRNDPLRIARRYFIVSLIGFALNLSFTWLLTGPLLHGPTWWPLVPAVFMTPLVTFMLNRTWVFA